MIRLAFFGLALAAAAGGAIAQNETAEPATGREATAQPRSGVTVRIDPETGEIRGYRVPDPRRLPDDRLERALSRSTKGLRAVTLPDGTVYVDLQGRFGHLQSARLNEDGSLEMRCVDSVRQLMSFVDHLGVRPTAAERQP